MAAGVYVTAVSDKGLERVHTSSFLSHFLFPLSLIVSLSSPLQDRCGQVPPVFLPATPKPSAQFVPREGLTVLDRTMGTDPPLFGPPSAW